MCIVHQIFLIKINVNKIFYCIVQFGECQVRFNNKLYYYLFSTLYNIKHVQNKLYNISNEQFRFYKIELKILYIPGNGGPILTWLKECHLSKLLALQSISDPVGEEVRN